MKQFSIIVSITAVLIALIFLLPPLLNPCAQMFEQTQLSIKASLDALQRGEVMLEQKQVQTLSKDSEKMAIAAEACCTAHQAGALAKGEFVACQKSLESYDSKLQRAVAVVEEARAAKAQENAALLAEKVAEVNTLVESTTTQAEEFIQHVEEVTEKDVDVDEGQIIGQDIEQAGNGGPLEWSDPHPTDYNDNFQHAQLVEDPRDAITEAIERRGDKDFFAIVTRDTKGTLRVRFEQTGPTQIGPHIAIIYGEQSSERWQPQPGTDLTAELRLDGSIPSLMLVSGTTTIMRFLKSPIGSRSPWTKVHCRFRPMRTGASGYRYRRLTKRKASRMMTRLRPTRLCWANIWLARSVPKAMLIFISSI